MLNTGQGFNAEVKVLTAQQYLDNNISSLESIINTMHHNGAFTGGLDEHLATLKELKRLLALEANNTPPSDSRDILAKTSEEVVEKIVSLGFVPVNLLCARSGKGSSLSLELKAVFNPDALHKADEAESRAYTLYKAFTKQLRKG